MELKEGKITLAQLAEWFGIQPSTIREKKAKEKKLKLLQTFADYHFEGRSIYIDKVHIPVYSKAYTIIEEQLPKYWHDNNLDTCSRVGIAIHSQCKEVNSQIKESTAKSYANRAKIKLFGRNHIEADFGTLGTSRYVWGTIDEEGQCHYLSDKEYEIISKCAAESYGSVLGNKAALLNDALTKKEITETEYCEGMIMTKEERAQSYFKFEKLVIQALGYMPERLTEITYGVSFEEKKE